MIYRFNAIETVLNPAERARRLARLYAFFEKTAAESHVSEAQDRATADSQSNEESNRLSHMIGGADKKTRGGNAYKQRH